MSATADASVVKENEAVKQALFTFLKRAIDEPLQSTISKESQKKIEDTVEKLKAWASDPRQLNVNFKRTFIFEISEFNSEVYKLYNSIDKLPSKTFSEMLIPPYKVPDTEESYPVNTRLEKALGQTKEIMKLLGDFFSDAIASETPDLKSLSLIELLETQTLLTSDMPPNEEPNTDLKMRGIQEELRMLLHFIPPTLVKKLFVSIEGRGTEKLADAMQHDELIIYTLNSCNAAIDSMSNDELTDTFKRMKRVAFSRGTPEAAAADVINLAAIRKMNFLVDSLQDIWHSWLRAQRKTTTFDPVISELVHEVLEEMFAAASIHTLDEKRLALQTSF